MRAMILIACIAITLSVVGVLAQNAEPAFPSCLQDAPPINVDFRNVTIAKVLPFLGVSCGIDIRVEDVEGTAAARQVPSVRFQQTKPVKVFLFLVRSAGLKFSVLDDKTIVVTKR